MQHASLAQLRLLAEKQERFASRYFDYQSAYRYALTLDDGLQVECTAYKHFFDRAPTALAIDISTMVGCPVKCKFCAAGAIKHMRSLTPDEMSRQVELLIHLNDQERFPKINCSFQGIGEPSLVASGVLSSARKLLGSDSRLTISIATTAACREAISLWGNSQITFENLQISCSAPTVEKAQWLAKDTPSPKEAFDIAKFAGTYVNFKKVKINYILIAGFNDSDDDLSHLVTMAIGCAAIVKVSTLNSTDASRRFGLVTSSLKRAKKFRDELIGVGVDSYVYGAFHGTTISCGQLLGRSTRLEGGTCTTTLGRSSVG